MADASLIMAGGTLFILYTVTVLGGASWLNKQLSTMKKEILQDFDKKHESNAQTVKALHELVIRHDVLLDPEFSIYSKSNGGNTRRHG